MSKSSKLLLRDIPQQHLIFILIQLINLRSFMHIMELLPNKLILIHCQLAKKRLSID